MLWAVRRSAGIREAPCARRRPPRASACPPSAPRRAPPQSSSVARRRHRHHLSAGIAADSLRNTLCIRVSRLQRMVGALRLRMVQGWQTPPHLLGQLCLQRVQPHPQVVLVSAAGRAACHGVCLVQCLHLGGACNRSQQMSFALTSIRWHQQMAATGRCVGRQQHVRAKQGAAAARLQQWEAYHADRGRESAPFGASGAATGGGTGRPWTGSAA